MEKYNVEKLLRYISPSLRECLKKKSSSLWEKAEEIHIASGEAALIYYNGGYEYIADDNSAFICDSNTVLETLMLISDNSVYAVNEKISNGFITISGGHRAGICGTAVMKDGKISTIKDISSINIRINREIKGVSNRIIDKIIKNGIVQNTLIISPPRCGKTTLLRDVARVLGDIYKVSIIDERSEIAACYNGVPQNKIGKLSDVLDSCPKELGIPLVVRSMAPQIIITDEIGNESDVKAINYAVSSGVNIIATAHGKNIYDVIRKNGFETIKNYFDTFITLTNIGGTGSIGSVLTRDEIDI